MQTTFNEAMTAAFAGAEADAGYDGDEVSARNDHSAALAYGLCVARGTADGDFAQFTSGAEPLGCLKHSHATAEAGDSGLGADEVGSVMRKGRIWVLVEDAVEAGDQAYARHTTSGADATKGAWRADNDGVAQVTTVTPTAANSTNYSLSIFVDGKLFTFVSLSDGSGDATEICDGFRTAMAANAAFTALVVATGTATLILTGQQAGKAFQVGSNGPGVCAVAATTAASVTADAVPGAFFRTSADADTLAVLELNLPAA